MAFLTSSSCTPLAAAAHTRLRGVEASRLLLLSRPGAASGQVGVAAVLPAAVGCTRAVASARTRCAAGDQAGTTTTEPLILSTVVTLAKEFRHWLTYPPKSKEDFKKIEITTSNCMGLCKRMIEIIFHLPAGDIHQWIDTIGEIDTTFVELHNQSRGENPWAGADIVEAAIEGLNRLAQIYLKCCFRCTAGERASSEPLTAATFTTLADQLRYWLTNPPKCKEDFKKMEIIAGKCMDLFPRMVHSFSLVPADILEEIASITVSIFVELHNQSRGEDPRADVAAIEATIKGVEQMAKIFLDGAPGLTGYMRP